VLMILPIVNIVIAFIVYIELAKKFGKSGGFGVGLIFLGIIFFPILAFGDAEYKKATHHGSHKKKGSYWSLN